MAEGLIARNSGGVIKIYDVETNMEVIDIEKHQIDRMKRVRVIMLMYGVLIVAIGPEPRTGHTPESILRPAAPGTETELKSMASIYRVQGGDFGPPPPVKKTQSSTPKCLYFIFLPPARPCARWICPATTGENHALLICSATASQDVWSVRSNAGSWKRGHTSQRRHGSRLRKHTS